MGLTAKLSGTLEITPEPGSAIIAGDSGQRFGLSNRAQNQSVAKENSSRTGRVASPSAYVALPVDSDMRAWTLVFQTKPSSAEIDIRISSAVSGDEDIDNVQGLLVVEKMQTDYITGISVQGTGEFEWALVGTRS